MVARAAGDGAFGDVFDELSGKFVAFVDVLGEVSERSALTSNADLLRLYENGSGRRADAAVTCLRHVGSFRTRGRQPVRAVIAEEDEIRHDPRHGVVNAVRKCVTL